MGRQCDFRYSSAFAVEQTWKWSAGSMTKIELFRLIPNRLRPANRWKLTNRPNSCSWHRENPVGIVRPVDYDNISWRRPIGSVGLVSFHAGCCFSRLHDLRAESFRVIAPRAWLRNGPCNSEHVCISVCRVGWRLVRALCIYLTFGLHCSGLHLVCLPR